MQQDMRLQLIIEAFNRTQTAWTELTVQTEKAKAEVVGLNAASASSGNVLDAAGKKGAQGMGQLNLAAQESAERMKRVGLSVAAFRGYIASAQAELPALQGKVAALKTPLDLVSVGAVAAGNALAETGKNGGQGLKQIHDQASSAHSMLGQMVQMAIVMGAILGSKKLAEGGIDYNRTLENSKLGVAAIMTSMGVITDQQGMVLQGQEKWNASQQITVDAQHELQKIGITTAATYEELVQAYQGMEAPMLSAKINFADSLELTGLLTNAVKSMSLPLNQIVQEGRDIVSGTIDMNSQLARSLQITNEDVKGWREKGTVFQEIKKRLEGFTYASREFEKTWDGAWSNFKDVAQKAVGEGSTPLFDFLKQEMIKFTNDMVNITRDASGKILDIQVKPEVTAKIRELAEDLKKLIKMLEQAVSWGSKLAEPAIWLGVALGIGKIALAIDGMYKTIAAGETLAAGSTLMRLIKNPQLLLAVAAIAGTAYAGNRAYDNVQVSKRADDIRASLGPANPALNVDQLQGPQLKKVLEKFPAATNEEIAKMIRGGGIKLSAPDFSDYYSSPDYKVYIDEKLSKQLIDPGKAPFNITGPNKESAEAKKKRLAAERAAAKKANDDAIAEAELLQRQSYGTIDQAREEDHEANRGWLHKQKLLHEEEKIDEAAWIESQRQFKLAESMIDDDAITKKILALNAEWEAKSSHYADGKALDSAYAAYSLQYDKLMLDATKATNAELVAGDEARIAAAKLKKKTETEAAKDAADAAKSRKAAAMAETAHQLAQLDIAEKTRETGKIDAMSRRKELLEELLSLQEADLAAMNKTADPQAWLSQQAAIDGTRQKLLDLQLQARDLSNDMAGGFREGLLQYVDETGGGFKRMVDLAQSAAQGMEAAFSDFFFDAMTGKLKSFGDYVMSFLNSVARAMANMMAQSAAQGIVGSLAGLFSPAKPVAALAPVTKYAHQGGLILHDGGLVVPRFHFGGLASDEVPAVLLKKERVLSQEQNVLFENFVNKTSGGAPNVAVIIHNQTGQPMSAKQSGTPTFSAGQWVIDVVADNISNHGVLGQMLAR